MFYKNAHNGGRVLRSEDFPDGASKLRKWVQVGSAWDTPFGPQSNKTYTSDDLDDFCAEMLAHNLTWEAAEARRMEAAGIVGWSD